jgi:hypothetical protein
MAGWIRRLSTDRALLGRMGDAAHLLARPQAARQVAELVQGQDRLVQRAGLGARRSAMRLRAQRAAVRGWRSAAPARSFGTGESLAVQP